MEYNIKYSEESKEELGEILYFITYIRRLEIYAEKVKRKILNKVKILSSSPEICGITGKKNREGYEYRKMIIDDYIVLYIINRKENIVLISHIIDGKSNYSEYLI